MEPLMVVSIIVISIVLLLLMGTPSKPLKFLGSLFAKVVIGGMLLFFLNAFGSSFGLHVPINAVTAGVAGILGVPGLLSLAAIQYWIL